MRSGCLRPLAPYAALLLISFHASVAGAAWLPGGNAVCVATGTQLAPAVIADGEGGVYVAWVDGRGSDDDIYVTRLASDGSIVPGWPDDGLQVATSPAAEAYPTLMRDGANGVFVAWSTGSALGLQRLTGLGAISPGWPAGGNAFGSSVGSQTVSRIPVTSNGSGGIYLVYNTGVGGIVAHQVSADGTFPPGWGTTGTSLGTPGSAAFHIAADGTGGFLLAWTISSVSSASLFVQRYDSDAVPQWASPQTLTFGAALVNVAPRFLPTTSGGALVGFTSPSGSGDMMSVHLDYGSDPPALGTAYVLCDLTSAQTAPRLVTDGAAGAFMSWQDSRAGSNLVITRLTDFGAIAGGWTADGNQPVAAARVSKPPALVASAPSSALLVWEDTRVFGQARIYGIRVDGAGSVSPGWASDGTPMSNVAGIQREPVAASDGLGGAIAVWVDFRSNAFGDLYAQRVSLDGQVAPVLGVPTLPIEWGLSAARPNPTRGEVAFALTLREGGVVRARLLDASGRIVRSLAHGPLEAGPHVLRWDGTDDTGRAAPDGMYFLQVEGPGGSANRRLALIR